MNNNENDSFEIKADELWQKADRILSVIKNINRQGGIVTQLMISAACIEVYSFVLYLRQIVYTYTERKVTKDALLNQSDLAKYIRLFHNALSDLECFDNFMQRKEEEKLIFDLKNEICEGDYPRLLQYIDYSENIDFLDSWGEPQTEGYSMRWQMLYDILYVIINNAILDMESIFQIVRKSKSKRDPELTNTFHEFIKDKERTEEIMKKLHRLIGEKKNSEALKIITRAWWIGWLIDKPTAPSIKAEFHTITCTEQYISKCLKEDKPTKYGKVDEKAIDKIRQEYESA